MEEISFPETSENFYETTRRNESEDIFEKWLVSDLEQLTAN
jgi:hypothetical protein